jgi:hypothetical protein
MKPLENVLLVSVFITNKSLNPVGDLGFTRTGSQVERLEIFLSALRSWSKLQPQNPYFFIELDSDFMKYRDLVTSEIEFNFSQPVIEWKRLLYYKDWFEISKDLARQNVDLITLITNDDHAYVHLDAQPFKDFSNEVTSLSQINGGRVLGDLTHFPGAIRTLSLYSNFHSNKGEVSRSHLVQTIHGCCLVTPKFFAEWWAFDFTDGKRIPRPDNPFGPNVEFAPTIVLTPSVEILRHMDGYGEGSRISRKYNVLRPSCRILVDADSQNLALHPWEYGLWPSRPHSYHSHGGPDLYNLFPQSDSAMERFRVDLSRLIIAYQKVYAPQLSRELIVKQDSNNLYVFAVNFAVLLDFETLFNFLIWLLFDLPNQLLIKLSVFLFGRNSLVVVFLQKIRNRIYQHLSVKILKYTNVFPKSH